MKTCSTCKAEQAYDQFPHHKQTRDGYASTCRSCRSKSNKRLYAKPEYKANMLANGKKWREANPSYNKEYRAGNREREKELHERWVKENRRRNNNTHIKNDQIRRARKAGVKVNSGVSLNAAFEKFQGICGICKLPVARSSASLDHIHPLSKGGSHTWDNIQLAHRLCNSRKGIKASASVA